MSAWRVAPEGSKTVYGDVGIWRQRRPDGQIAIQLGAGKGQNSTVASDPASRRGNPHLCGRLRGILIEHGQWPIDPGGDPFP